VLGALGGLLHAVATVTFGVDHIVSGVAVNIVALGATQYLAAVAFTGVPGGGETQSPRIQPMGTLTVPGVSDAMNSIAAQGWFLVSDIAGIIGGLTTGVSYLTIIAGGLVVMTFFVLWRTAFGLRLRSCGEAPYAAETLGVNVLKYKYLAVVASGAFAGVGGAYLAIVAASIYREGQTGGRGYIGLAAMIFGNWRPGGLAMGSGLFGYADAMQLRSAEAVHALLLLAAIAAVLYAGWMLRKGSRTTALVSGLLGVGLGAWYLGTDELPRQVLAATPYVVTLLVLAFASQRLRMPAANGLRYRRGEGR
jgi:simple sugar transport system permease protein